MGILCRNTRMKRRNTRAQRGRLIRLLSLQTCFSTRSPRILSRNRISPEHGAGPEKLFHPRMAQSTSKQNGKTSHLASLALTKTPFLQKMIPLNMTPSLPRAQKLKSTFSECSASYMYSPLQLILISTTTTAPFLRIPL